MKLEPIIGLEIHAQLKTQSKMFCSCPNRGELDPPNTNICPTCMGHPGTLPSINRQALIYGLKIAKALDCQLANYSKFDRKNYFYPDLPKGYQISQFDLPIAGHGELTLKVNEGQDNEREFRVGITRVHLEEDAAKLHHSGVGAGKISLVDFNRGGTPLAEIVTEPDLRSPAEAKAFLQELRLLLRYMNVSDADMEKGNMRCDANISLREIPDNQTNENWTKKFYPKTEIKNLNSFRAVERALEFEIKRQTKLWLDNQTPTFQSTRGWDDVRGVTVEQRTKEGSSDYRYFPEPDLPPLDLNEIREQISISELPEARRRRFMEQYKLSRAEAKTMCEQKELADFAERVFSELDEWTANAGASKEKMEPLTTERRAKLVSGWLLTKLVGIMTERKLDIRTCKITPENFAELLTMVHASKVTGPNALIILIEMTETGADPSLIMEEKNLGQMDDLDNLRNVIKQAINENPRAVDDWRSGKTTAVQFLVGQVMKLSRGKAPPEETRQLLEQELTEQTHRSTSR
jgi:aspartyl-tRNA(Asn)/glutamyl-tRNA(Gln) amidotransferase subunit B